MMGMIQPIYIMEEDLQRTRKIVKSTKNDKELLLEKACKLSLVKFNKIIHRE